MFFSRKPKNYKDVTPSEFKTLMTEIEDAILVDVRTPEEHQAGNLPNSLLIDFRQSDFLQHWSDLDKDKTYLIYCRSGARSGSACQMLSKHGFTKLYNLAGGFMSWR